MSDERLRELQRRFQTTGTVADEAALLRARWHAGELTEDKLVLAAYAGSEAAGLVVESPDEPATASAWVSRLRHVLGYPAELAIAAARMTSWLAVAWVLSRRDGLHRPAERSNADLDRALALMVRGWEFQTQALAQALGPLIPRYPSEPEDDPEEVVAQALDPFADPFAGPFADLLEDPVLDVFQAAHDAFFPDGGTTGVNRAADAASAAARVVGDAPLIASFRRGVREWALGAARPDPETLIE